MGPRSRWLVIATLALAVVAAVSVLATASGEGPPGSNQTRAVSVEGTASVPIGPHDSAGVATGVYREAMAKALGDGQAKAAFLAEKSSVALGLAVSITEQGGYIECSGTTSEYAEYEGEQPDFGYAAQPTSTGVAAPLAAATAPSKETSSAQAHVRHAPKHKPKKHVAKAAATNSAASCNLTANVALVYAIG